MPAEWVIEVREQLRFALGWELAARLRGAGDDADHVRTEILRPFLAAEWVPNLSEAVARLGDTITGGFDTALEKVPKQFAWELTTLLGAGGADLGSAELVRGAVRGCGQPGKRRDHAPPYIPPETEELFTPPPVERVRLWLTEATGLAAWQAWWYRAQAQRPAPEFNPALVEECAAAAEKLSPSDPPGEHPLSARDKELGRILRDCVEALQATAAGAGTGPGADFNRLGEKCQKLLDDSRHDSIFWPPRELVRLTERLREANPDRFGAAAALFLRAPGPDEHDAMTLWSKEIVAGPLRGESSWQAARLLLVRVLAERLGTELTDPATRAALLDFTNRLFRFFAVGAEIITHPQHVALDRLVRRRERGVTAPVLTHPALAIRTSSALVPFSSAVVREPEPRSRLLTAADEFGRWAERGHAQVAELAANLSAEWDRAGGAAEWWRSVAARRTAGDAGAVDDVARFWFFLQCAELLRTEAGGEVAVRTLLTGLAEAGFRFAFEPPAGGAGAVPGPWLAAPEGTRDREIVLRVGPTVYAPDGTELDPAAWLAFPVPGPPSGSAAALFGRTGIGVGLAAVRLVDPDWDGWDAVAADLWAGTPAPRESLNRAAARRLVVRFLRRTWEREKSAAHAYYLRLTRELIGWLDREVRAPLGVPLDPNTLRRGQLSVAPSGVAVRWVKAQEPVKTLVDLDVDLDADPDGRVTVAVSMGSAWPPEVARWWSVRGHPPGCPVLQEWARQIVDTLPWLIGRPVQLQSALEGAANRFRAWLGEHPGARWLDQTVRLARGGNESARAWLVALTGAGWCRIYPSVDWATGAVSWPDADAPAAIAWAFDPSVPKRGVIEPVEFFSADPARARCTLSRGPRASGTPGDLAEQLVACAEGLGGEGNRELVALARSIAAREQALPPDGDVERAAVDTDAGAFLDALVTAANRAATPPGDPEARPNYATIRPERAEALDAVLGHFRRWAGARGVGVVPGAWSFTAPPDARTLRDEVGCQCRLMFREEVAVGSVVRADVLGLVRGKTVVRDARLLASAGKEPSYLTDLFDLLKECRHPEAQALLERLKRWPQESLEGRLPAAVADLFVALWSAEGFREADPTGFQRVTETVAALMASAQLYILMPDTIQQYPASWVEVRDGRAIQTGRVRRIIRPVVLDSSQQLRIPGIVEAE